MTNVGNANSKCTGRGTTHLRWLAGKLHWSVNRTTDSSVTANQHTATIAAIIAETVALRRYFMCCVAAGRRYRKRRKIYSIGYGLWRGDVPPCAKQTRSFGNFSSTPPKIRQQIAVVVSAGIPSTHTCRNHCLQSLSRVSETLVADACLVLSCTDCAIYFCLSTMHTGTHVVIVLNSINSSVLLMLGSTF